jgi:hypothetical protein
VKGDETARFERFARHGREGEVPGVQALAGTFHDRSAAAQALATDRVDLAFVRYNPAHWGAERDVFPALREGRRGRLFGFLSTSWYVPHARFVEIGFSRDCWKPAMVDHYRFVLTQRRLDGILCAPQTPAQLDELGRAMDAGPLCPRRLEYMKRAADLHLGRLQPARRILAQGSSPAVT